MVRLNMYFIAYSCGVYAEFTHMNQKSILNYHTGSDTFRVLLGNPGTPYAIESILDKNHLQGNSMVSMDFMTVWQTVVPSESHGGE